MNTEQGKKNWVFCDGDLPPKTGGPMDAHESLMILNLNDADAEIKVTVLFEDKDPVENITLKVAAKRVRCFRLDGPIGDIDYQIPFGQYALSLRSDVPIFAVFGRLDTRQANLAYYTVQGHSY
ncbi:MAG: sensory rhodopsin transducer [Eubacteriales bacterium]|jgi:hypothetical protein|nr:sensory rhodopsin transducer [Eubacteriales bacterium]